jgi:hypothetical protein
MERRPAGAGQLANEAVRGELVSRQISQAVDGLWYCGTWLRTGLPTARQSQGLDHLVLADGVLHAAEPKATSPPVSGQ